MAHLDPKSPLYARAIRRLRFLSARVTDLPVSWEIGGITDEGEDSVIESSTAEICKGRLTDGTVVAVKEIQVLDPAHIPQLTKVNMFYVSQGELG
jgi:hypothetical protein